jgi:hypothetical protein
MSLDPSKLFQILLRIGQSPITSILVVVGFMRFITKGIESALKFLGQAYDDYVDFLIRYEGAKLRLKNAVGKLKNARSRRDQGLDTRRPPGATHSRHERSAPIYGTGPPEADRRKQSEYSHRSS